MTHRYFGTCSPRIPLVHKELINYFNARYWDSFYTLDEAQRFVTNTFCVSHVKKIPWSRQQNLRRTSGIISDP